MIEIDILLFGISIPSLHLYLISVFIYFHFLYLYSISTSLLKWKPDYLAAEPHFQKAARAFKAAGLMDSAIDAWRKAADAAYRMGNLKQAAITLENAGREVVSNRNTK